MRLFLLASAATLALTAPAMVSAQQTPPAQQQGESQQQQAFTLEPLPYAADALEPVIDRQTMVLHHDKHHQAYVDALNKAIGENPELKGKSLEDLLEDAGKLPDVVRNNAGGHWNHTFFWKIMTKPDQSGSPSGELAEAINEEFGSLDEMKAAFEDAGKTRFGSGWVWLMVDDDGQLAVTSTPNQDNPLMDVADEPGIPILGNDLWEHAYYLKYQNRRPDYLKAWWGVVNWDEVSRRYAEALKEAKQGD